MTSDQAEELVHRLEMAYLARVILAEQLSRGSHVTAALEPAYYDACTRYWAAADEIRTRLSSTLSEIRGAS